MTQKNYAHIDDNYNVINLLVSTDEMISTLEGNYIEYSISGEFKANPAVIGGKFDPENNVFLVPKPYDSWIFNSETFRWDPPVSKPEGPAAWDEINQRWNTPL